MSSSKTNQPALSTSQELEQRLAREEIEHMVREEPDLVFNDQEMEDVPEEDRITDEDATAAAPPLTSTDPTQPLLDAPAITAALDEISTGFTNPAATLRELAAAKKQADAAAKADAEKVAVMGRALNPRPDKRARNPSLTSPTNAGKKAEAENPAPQPDVDMREARPTKNRPMSFGHFWKPNRLNCAVRIGNNEIMGNPLAPSPGYDVKLSLDPGVQGQPSVGLTFKFAKDGIDSNKADHCNSFAVGWVPGAKVGPQWMMENGKIQRAADPVEVDRKITFPPAIEALCKKPGDKERLSCFSRTTSTSHRQ